MLTRNIFSWITKKSHWPFHWNGTVFILMKVLSHAENWQLSVQHVMKISSKWYFCFCVTACSAIKYLKSLTHSGRVTHICVIKLSIIGSNNGLSPDRRQAIIWTNAGILLIGSLEANFNDEIFIGIHSFSFKKICFIMPSGKWRPFCLGLNMLMAMAIGMEINLPHLGQLRSNNINPSGNKTEIFWGFCSFWEMIEHVNMFLCCRASSIGFSNMLVITITKPMGLNCILK